VHTHDGFYLRLSLGAGWGQVKSSATDFEATYKGGGWLMDILLGGTISNTVVIGGGFLIHEISNPDVEVNAEALDEVSGNGDALGIVTLGPFVDFYFGPNSGGHVGSMIGVASIGLEAEDGETSSGWGWSLFGGYDFWVSDNWGLGVNARYMYAKGKREFDGISSGSDVVFQSFTVNDTAHTFGVMFSALYN